MWTSLVGKHYIASHITLYGKRNFTDIIKVMNLKIGWIIWMGLTEPLKAEDLLWLESERCGRRESVT